MTYLEAAKTIAKLEPLLDQLWRDYPDAVVGHGVQLQQGKLEVVIRLKKDIPALVGPEIAGVPIRVEMQGAGAKPGSEHALDVWHCTSCPLEFAIVCLNSDQKWDDDPSCPQCGDNGDVHKIQCLDFRMVERSQQYELVKTIKALPE